MVQPRKRQEWNIEPGNPAEAAPRHRSSGLLDVALFHFLRDEFFRFPSGFAFVHECFRLLLAPAPVEAVRSSRARGSKRIPDSQLELEELVAPAPPLLLSQQAQ